MYAQAARSRFHRRRFPAVSRSPVSLQGFQKGFQMGIHARNEKCDCIKYLKLGDLVLQILSFVAQSERENIKRRQAEGIAAARARGVHLGRPVKTAPVDFGEIVSEWEKGTMKLDEALKRSGMSESTFYRLHPVVPFPAHTFASCDGCIVSQFRIIYRISWTGSTIRSCTFL